MRQSWEVPSARLVNNMYTRKNRLNASPDCNENWLSVFVVGNMWNSFPLNCESGWTLNYLWQSLVPLDISTDSIILIRRVRGYSRFFLPTDRVNFLALTEGVVYVWRSESSNYACINKMVISADCGWGSIEVDGWPGEIREQVGT